MRRGLLLAVMVLACAGPAEAITLVTPEGESPPDLPVQAWADASVMPSSPGSVWFVNRPCPPPYDFLLACVQGDTLYGGGIGWPGALYHELGHLFSAHVLTDAGREKFRRITGDYAPDWYAPPGQPSPEERFADAYWLCASRARYPSIMSATVQRRVCALIRREGGWNMTYRGAR